MSPVNTSTGTPREKDARVLLAKAGNYLIGCAEYAYASSATWSYAKEGTTESRQSKYAAQIDGAYRLVESVANNLATFVLTPVSGGSRVRSRTRSITLYSDGSHLYVAGGASRTSRTFDATVWIGVSERGGNPVGLNPMATIELVLAAAGDVSFADPQSETQNGEYVIRATLSAAAFQSIQQEQWTLAESDLKTELADKQPDMAFSDAVVVYYLSADEGIPLRSEYVVSGSMTLHEVKKRRSSSETVRVPCRLQWTGKTQLLYGATGSVLWPDSNDVMLMLPSVTKESNPSEGQ